MHTCDDVRAVRARRWERHAVGVNLVRCVRRCARGMQRGQSLSMCVCVCACVCVCVCVICLCVCVCVREGELQECGALCVMLMRL